MEFRFVSNAVSTVRPRCPINLRFQFGLLRVLRFRSRLSRPHQHLALLLLVPLLLDLVQLLEEFDLSANVLGHLVPRINLRTDHITHSKLEGDGGRENVL